MKRALDTGAQKKALSETLRKYPERTLSRLLGPRRLDSNADYVACVVPTFDVGRKAGLGEMVSEEDERALSPAWTAGSPNSDRAEVQSGVPQDSPESGCESCGPVQFEAKPASTTPGSFTNFFKNP